MQIPASQKADQSSQELGKSQGKEGIQVLPVLVSILSIAFHSMYTFTKWDFRDLYF